jgi:hypothetical protein
LRVEEPVTKDEKMAMKNNPEKLCDLLNQTNKTVYLFVGKQELYSFPLEASCLSETKRFEN